MLQVERKKTHLACTQLSWKLLSKDDHVTRARPITFTVITTEGSEKRDSVGVRRLRRYYVYEHCGKILER